MSTPKKPWYWYDHIPDKSDSKKKFNKYVSKIVKFNQLHEMYHGYTPLAWFSKNKYYEVVEMLIRCQDLNPNYGLENGLCGSHYPLITLSDYEWFPEIVQRFKDLVKKGANLWFRTEKCTTTEFFWKNPDVIRIFTVHKKMRLFRFYTTKRDIFPLDVIERICTWVVEV